MIRILLRILFVFVALSTNTLIAQTFIQGTIRDSETRAPLPYAHVVLLDENVGTLSNNDGYFEIRSGKTTTHLQISYIGYETKLIELTSGEINNAEAIFLRPKVYTINEVVISPDRIINLIKAIYNYYKSKKDEQYSAEAFYRDYTTVDNFPVKASEIFYKLKINRSGIGDWNFIQGRSAEAKKAIEEPSIDFLFTIANNPSFFIRNFPVTEFVPAPLKQDLNQNVVISPICENPKKNYIYEKIGEKKIDNQKVSVITFYPATKSGKFRFNGKLEIIEDELQVIYMEVVLNHPMFFYRLRKMYKLKERDQYVDSLYSRHVWQYNKINNVWFLERIENIFSFRVRSKTDKNYKKIDNTTSQLYFYNINAAGTSVGKNQTIKENDIKLIQNTKYDPGFWQIHTKEISEIPFEKSIRESFLENGFYGNLFPGGITSIQYPQCSDSENELIRKLNENYYMLFRNFIMYFYYIPEKEISILFKNDIRSIYDEYIDQITNHNIPVKIFSELDEVLKKSGTAEISYSLNLWMEMNPNITKNIITKFQQLEKRYNK